MVLLIIILVSMSAAFSGLSIGMFSLSISSLERKIRLGDKYASRVLSIRKEGNFLLCTLLLGNVAVNSGLTLAMSSVSSGVIATASSTILIFVFGEVAPQAVFTRFALKIGYYTAWLVKIFMFLMWPIAKPISMLLDYLLGKEFPEKYSKVELKDILAEHSGESIDNDEHRIISGALKFSEKTAKEVLTPATIMFHLDEQLLINQMLLNKIRSENYSRIPVYSKNRDNIIGILYAKDLIGYDINSKKSVGELCDKTGVLSVREDIYLDSLMNTFIKNKKHMAFVFDSFGLLHGLITLEDIIEEVLAIEIQDESDTVADLQHLAKRKAQKHFTNEVI